MDFLPRSSPLGGSNPTPTLPTAVVQWSERATYNRIIMVQVHSVVPNLKTTSCVQTCLYNFSLANAGTSYESVMGLLSMPYQKKREKEKEKRTKREKEKERKTTVGIPRRGIN